MFANLFQDLAELLSVAHLSVSMSAMTILTYLLTLPPATGTDSIEGILDKRVCAAYQKKTSLIGGLARLGIQVSGSGLSGKEQHVATWVSAMFNMIFGPENSRSFRMVEMGQWVNRRYWVLVGGFCLPIICVIT